MLKLSAVLTGLCVPALAAISLATSLLDSRYEEEQVRDVSDFNLDKGLAIDGYDPVAYFPGGRELEEVLRREEARARVDELRVTTVQG
jgi:hypothetical protein